MGLVEEEDAVSQRVCLRASHLIERDLRGAGLEFEASRAVERIGDNRAAASFRLSVENRLVDERGLTINGADVFSDTSAEIRHLAASQSPIQTVRLIQVHHLKRCVASAETAADTLVQLDGCTETVVAEHARDLRGNNDLLVLTRPDVISDIHHEYLDAGADIIETNTFSSNSVAQSDYGLESIVYELNVEGARLARHAADEWTRRTPDRPRLVAGSMGPTNRILSISPDVNNPAFRNVTFDGLREAFKEQARGLIDGGCDLLLLETIVDTLNAKAGIVAIEEVFEETGVRLPLMISVTITDRSGRTLSGQTIDAFWVSIAHARPFSVGVNCALGARDMTIAEPAPPRESPVPEERWATRELRLAIVCYGGVSLAIYMLRRIAP